MKDQEYIQIMNRISKDKIEEAFMWNASANQKRHSIRQLSTGVGAIAAAIAIVIGGIGYRAHQNNQLTSSVDDNSRISNDGSNLFGGHGEIRGFVSTIGDTLFCDDDCYYLLKGIHSEGEGAAEGGASPDSFDYLRWEMNGSTAMKQFEYDGRLLTDGEQLYTYHDGKLFITDSYGSETVFSDVPWKPCAIQKLSDGLYFLSAFVEDSWIDGDPKPYVLLNQKDGSSSFVDFNEVQSESKGEVLYFRQENKIYRAPLTAPDEATLIADYVEDWRIVDDTLYYIYETNGIEMYCTKPVSSDTQHEEIQRVSTDEPDPTNHLWQHDFFSRQKTELFTAAYTYRDDDLEFHVTAAGTPLFPPGASSECYSYSVSAAELWGDDLPDTNVRPFMEFFDTGTHIVFTLPQDGRNGEQLVQLVKETGEYSYFGENFAPEQPQTKQPQEDQIQESAAFNSLGGRGSIRCFYSDYAYEYAEDDEYYYDISNNLRAQKTDGDTVYEAFTPLTVPQFDSEEHPEHKVFVTDNMVLFFEDDTLYEVHAHGNGKYLTNTIYDIVLELTEDNEGNPIENGGLSQVRGFAKDAEGTPTKLFLRGGASITGRPEDDPGYIFNAILDLKTGEFKTLFTYGYVMEWKVTEDAVYAAGYNLTTQVPVKNESGDPAFDDRNYELVRFDDDGMFIPVSTPDWRFGGLTVTSIYDGYIWFVNMDGECCKGNIQDSSLTVISQSEYRAGYSNIYGGKGVVYIDDDPQRIVFRKPDGVSEIVLKEGREYPSQRYSMAGSYTENGVIHIVVSESDMPEIGESKHIRDIVYIIDGDSVSSYGISAPT